MNQSKKWSLNWNDMKYWLFATLAFFAPTLVVFFMEMQKGTDLKGAALVAKVVLFGSIIDLLRRFMSGK